MFGLVCGDFFALVRQRHVWDNTAPVQKVIILNVSHRRRNQRKKVTHCLCVYWCFWGAESLFFSIWRMRFYSTVMQSSHRRLPSKAAACFNFAISLQVKINLELFKQTKWAVCKEGNRKESFHCQTCFTRHQQQRHPPVCSPPVTNTVTRVPCPRSAPPGRPLTQLQPCWEMLNVRMSFTHFSAKVQPNKVFKASPFKDVIVKRDEVKRWISLIR